MNGLIKQLSVDKTIWYASIATTLLLLLTIAFTILFFTALPPVVPLFNQLPWGTARLFDKAGLIIPAILIGIFLLINVFIVQKVYAIAPMLARMLAISTLLAALLTLVFTFRIINLII